MKSGKLGNLILTVLLMSVGVFASVLKSDIQEVKGNFEKETVTKTFKFKFSSPEQIAKLHIKADLAQGSTTWTLVSPNGKKNLNLELEADGNENARGTAVSNSLDYLDGEWLVIVKATKATGNYQLTWETVLEKTLVPSASLYNNLTADACREDLQILRGAFEEGHAGYTRYTKKENLDNLFSSAIQQCRRQKQEWEFFRLVSELTTDIKDGHSRVALPENLENELNDKMPLLPFYVIVDGTQAVIFQDLRKTTNKLNGVEILDINGVSTPLILERLRQATPVDGDIPTAKNRRIEGWAFIRGLQTINNLSSPFTLRLKNAQGRVFEQPIEGETLKSLREKFEKSQGLNNLPPAELKFYDNNSIAYLKIRQFFGKFDPNIAADFPTFFQKSFIQISQNKSKSLIIDLRGNRGGQTELGPLLLSYLFQSPISQYRKIATNPVKFKYLQIPKDFVESIKTDGLKEQTDGSFLDQNPEAIKVSEPNFQGNVYVLQDGLSFSVAADVVAILRHKKRAIFLGEESGGTYGGNTSGWDANLTLPNSKLRIRMPLVAYYSAVENDFPLNRGVAPDYSLGMSLKERLQGNDVILEQAMRLARR